MEGFILDADDDDAAANLLQRRLFAVQAAVRNMHLECEVLREVMSQAEKAWRGSRARLADLELLRDSLAMQMAELCGNERRPSKPENLPEVLSAA